MSQNKYRALDQKELKRLINYDPKSGIFTWKVSTSNRVTIGAIAGTIPKIGRRIIRIGTYNYHANKLAWLYVYGRWPIGDVDHKDLNKSNDAIDNLREATRSQNNANMGLRSDSTSGFKGVCKRGDKFQAYITVNKTRIHLGMFETAELAHSAYYKNAQKFYGEYARSK